MSAPQDALWVTPWTAPAQASWPAAEGLEATQASAAAPTKLQAPVRWALTAQVGLSGVPTALGPTSRVARPQGRRRP